MHRESLPAMSAKLQTRLQFGCCLLLSLTGCAYMRTPYAIEQLNGTNAPPSTAKRVPETTRVSRLVRQHLTDAYVSQATVSQWLLAVEQHPKPLSELVTCLYEKQNAGDPDECYALFMGAVAPLPRLVPTPPSGYRLDFGTSVWKLPAPPLELAAPGANPDTPVVSMARLLDRSSPETATELDAERFIGNVRAIGSSLVALSHVLGRPLDDKALNQGIQAGAALARDYLTHRPWHRSIHRPTTAVVMSGGAANGAFTAGYMWRLFEVLESCRKLGGPSGCQGAKIDLVVGTSTGSLVGVVTDMYFTQGLEKRAMELLVDSYTCSVESDLYCANDVYDWRLFEDTRGLVRFDGIRGKLEKNLLPAMIGNQTELIAVSVDYESGDVYAISDQDPADDAPLEGRIDGILASIVEPVLAEPVDGLRRHGKKLEGTFVDGGIRSGLPVMQAVDRGAERVLILSTSSIEADPIERPKHALGMLNRSIDLMVQQPRVGEVEQAEFAAVARRLAEYNQCTDRLRTVSDTGTAESRGDLRQFCERRQGFGVEHPSLKAAVSTWIGPQLFPQVAQSYKSQWVFRPEENLATAGGYSFTPKVMRPLFEQGVRTFQARCGETLRLLEVGGTVAAAACSEQLDVVMGRAKAQFKPIEQCTAGKEPMRVCE